MAYVVWYRDRDDLQMYLFVDAAGQPDVQAYIDVSCLLYTRSDAEFVRAWAQRLLRTKCWIMEAPERVTARVSYDRDR